MSDCHDKSVEERKELIAIGRRLLTDTAFGCTGEQTQELRTVLDRALDAIEWVDYWLGDSRRRIEEHARLRAEAEDRLRRLKNFRDKGARVTNPGGENIAEGS